MFDDDPPIFIINGKSCRQFARTLISSKSPGINAIYVDYTNGSDKNAGTLGKPLQTDAAALQLFRSRNDGCI